MVLRNGQCVCPTGYYLTTSPLGCSPCDSTCKGCSGPLSTQCTSCNNNLMLFGGQCQCPAQTYYDSATSSCLACSSLCKTCTGPNSSQCSSCKNNLALLTTPTGACGCTGSTYFDSSTQTCKSCDYTCDTCSGLSANQCTGCASGLTLTSGQCLCTGGGCSCPSGTYFESTSETCQPCDPTCATCTGPSSSECSSCRADYTYIPNYCQCGTSSCSCPSGTYFDAVSSTCLKCNSLCVECVGFGSNQCTSCPADQVLAVNPGSCGCPAGTYKSSSSYCLSCDETCGSCSGPSSTQCLTCKSGLSFYGSYCVCPAGSYFDLSTGTCQSCDSTCQTCSGPELNQCLTCPSGMDLIQGYCASKCASGQYRAADLSCMQCDSSCLTCSTAGANKCSSCVTNKVLTAGTCPNVYNGCYYTCGSCLSSSSSACTTCKSGFILVELGSVYGYCDTKCPINYYLTTEGGQMICKPKVVLDNRLAYGPSLNIIKLTFGTDISAFLTELLNTIEVAIVFRSDQSYVTYTYTLSPIKSDNTSLLLDLSFQGHLLANNLLYITYNIPSVDSDDNSSSVYVLQHVQTIRLIEFFNNVAGQWEYVDTAALISRIGLQANQVFSWTSSMVLRSVHSMRSQAVEDMIGYFIFLNVDFMQNFLTFANDGLNSFELIIPNLFSNVLNALDSSSSKRRRVLELKGQDAIDDNLHSREFLINHGAATTLLVIGFGALVLAEIARYFAAKMTRLPKLEFILTKISASIMWNFLYGHFSSEYQGFVFFSLLQISSGNGASNGAQYMNWVFGVGMFLVSTVGMIWLIWFTNKIFKKLQANKEKGKNESHNKDILLDRWEILYGSFKTDRFVELLYPHFLTLRCMGFGFVLIFLGVSPFVQLAYLLLTTIGMMYYLHKVKPLKTKPQQILTVTYEVLFLLVSIMTTIYHVYSLTRKEDEEGRSVICLIILSLATCMFILNLTSFCFEVIELRKQFYEWRKKRREALYSAGKGMLMDIKKRSSSTINQQSSSGNSMLMFSGVLSDQEEKQPIALSSTKAVNNYKGLNDLLKKKKGNKNSDESVVITDDEEKAKEVKERIEKRSMKRKNEEEEVFGGEKIVNSKVLDGVLIDSKSDTPVSKPRKINQIVPQSLHYSYNNESSIISDAMNTPKPLVLNDKMILQDVNTPSIQFIDDLQSRKGKLKEIIAKQFVGGNEVRRKSKQDDEAEIITVTLGDEKNTAQGRERVIKRSQNDLSVMKRPSESESLTVSSLVLEDHLPKLLLRERIPRSSRRMRLRMSESSANDISGFGNLLSTPDKSINHENS